MTPAKQAQLPLRPEQRVHLNSADEYFVGVQNIALARIDVVPENGTRRVVLNLFGTRDIDRLIAALGAAKVAMDEEQRVLNETFRKIADQQI